MRIRDIPLSLSAIVVWLASPAAFATPILDQYQTSHNGALPVFTDRQVAQTFTAGISGQLHHIIVGLDAAVPSRPATVEIRATSAGAPIGAVLGSVYFPDGFLPWTVIEIDFLSQNIILTAGSTYAIVFWSNAPREAPFNDVHTFWDREAYLGGELWVNEREAGEWSGWYIHPGAGSAPRGGDMQFRTYMVPEPSVLVLLGLGLMVLAAGRRRR